MTDEHDPRHSTQSVSDTPQPQEHVGGREFAKLEAKVTYLEERLQAIELEEKDGLSSLDARIDGLESRFNVSKGLLSGILIGLSLLSFVVVGAVKDILAHVYDYVSHGNHPP